MLAVLTVILCFTVVFGLAYFQCQRVVWMPTIIATLLILSFFQGFTPFLVLVWLIAIAACCLFGMTSLRIQWFTQPIWHFLRRRLPPLSQTEQIALDAGDVWWEGELLSGNPCWEKLHQFPKPELSAKERNFLDHQVNTLCRMLDDWKIMQQGDLPEPVWAYIKQERFWGMTIPETYGGWGFSAVAHAIVISKIASRSLSAAVSIMVPNSLGPGELLRHYGTEEQKSYYLPRLACGKEIPCFALTGLEIGSDASHMPDKGIICYDNHEGKKTLGIRLNWEKRYITLAPIATVLGLAFKLYDPDHLLGEKVELGITLALVPSTHLGVTMGERHAPLGLAFPNGPSVGKNVFIPMAWLIGGSAMAGQGWRMLMECLSIGRGISLPALSAGFSQLCYLTTGAYARVRQQFKQSIGKFEGVAEKLALIGGFTYITEASRLLTATAVDLGVKPAVASAITKYHLTEFSRISVNASMDIHAGRGIQTGPRNYLATPYRALPMSITVEGANILTRSLMIFGQGAIRCHPFLRQEMALLSLEETPAILQQFDELLLRHIGAGIGHFVSAFLGGLTKGKVGKAFSSPYARYYRQLNRMSSALALTTDVTLLCLGGDLKRKEFLSARLGDVLSHLYLASAVLKYAKEQPPSEEETQVVIWALEYSLSQIQIAFDDLFNNYSHPILGKILRWFIFPWGRAYLPVKDIHHQNVSNLMLTKNKLRERLTQYVYIPDDAEDVVGRMEYAMTLAVQTEKLQKKLKQTLHYDRRADFNTQIQLALEHEIITLEEAEALRAFNVARIHAIQVDVF